MASVSGRLVAENLLLGGVAGGDAHGEVSRREDKRVDRRARRREIRRQAAGASTCSGRSARTCGASRVDSPSNFQLRILVWERRSLRSRRKFLSRVGSYRDFLGSLPYTGYRPAGPYTSPPLPAAKSNPRIRERARAPPFSCAPDQRHTATAVVAVARASVWRPAHMPSARVIMLPSGAAAVTAWTAFSRIVT